MRFRTHGILAALALLPAAALAQSAPAYTLPPDKLAQAQALDHIRTLLHFGDALWGIAVLWLLLQTRAAARLAAFLERRIPRPSLSGLAFFAVLIAALSLASLPIDAYAHSVSVRYGISVQSWPSWFLDLAKALALSLVLGAPILLLFHWIVRRAPRRYWLAGWAAAVALSVLGAFAEPLAEPLFNQYEPLAKSNPALAARLEQVVARTGTQIPADRMYLMKASAKTNGLNAYVSGLGATKRVVVWDTTAGRIPDDEILFIFGHESGHYVLHHIPQGLALGALAMLALFWAGSRLAAALVRRLGPRWAVPSLHARSGFLVLLLLASVANFVFEPVSNAVSRHFEHQADLYGQEAVHGLVPDPQQTAVRAFNHLGLAWLETPTPNSFVVWWTYSHPSTAARAAFARDYNPWANNGHGLFFAR